jgi:hypothetical protein
MKLGKENLAMLNSRSGAWRRVAREPRAGISIFLALAFLFPLQGNANPQELTLFDFEEPAELEAWSALALQGAAERDPPPALALSSEEVPGGGKGLRINFQGGTWPAVSTRRVPVDWTAYQTLLAEVRVSRPCLVGFTVLQEKSSRAHTWEGDISRWTTTALVAPGWNHLASALHPPNDYAISSRYGKVLSLEFFLYEPRPGESVLLDRLRLSPSKTPPEETRTEFTVAGRDFKVKDVTDLGRRLKGEWKRPLQRTLEEVEAGFRAQLEELKKSHPRAVLATFRDGEKGYNPRHPERIYSGWKDAYFSSHGPDTATVERAENGGRRATGEVFMRHRSPLFQVDLSSIPPGSKVLAALLIVVRQEARYDQERNPEEAPSMWAVEPCNRPWEEYEVNAYRYARDRFWKEIGGRWYGEDPDFLPIYLAHGPGTGKVNVWDFREAVKFWTSGGRPNHGFMLHSDGHDWMMGAFYREAPEPKDRPAVLCIYEPGAGEARVETQIDERLREYEPRREEKRFDEIGWAGDIREAIRLGKAHRRPVFLFTHDGRMNTGRC